MNSKTEQVLKVDEAGVCGRRTNNVMLFSPS